ncbi:MAG: SGNH/GDSL hydrolase family protein [Bacteroidota bacterium]
MVCTKMLSKRSFIKKASFGLAGTLLVGPLTTFAEQAAFNSVDYNADKGLTILFQGDSITDGNHGREEWDLNHIMGHGYAYSIASRLGADHPEKHLKFINRGISGNRITDLAARWKPDTLDLQPDVLSILVGINDSDSYLKDKSNGVSVKTYADTYRSLLDQTKAKYPKVHFVLGEPFTLPFSSIEAEKTERQRDVAARSAVVKQLAKEYNAAFIPYQQVFSDALKRAPEKYWIWDHIHPTVAGHEIMSRAWLKGAKQFMNL